MTMYIHSYVYLATARYEILQECLTLTCGYKMGGVSAPVRSAKLKIIYGSKTSKTADLDTISIQILYIHMYYVYGWWLYTLKGEGGGRVPPNSLNKCHDN